MPTLFNLIAADPSVSDLELCGQEIFQPRLNLKFGGGGGPKINEKLYRCTLQFSTRVFIKFSCKLDWPALRIKAAKEPSKLDDVSLAGVEKLVRLGNLHRVGKTDRHTHITLIINKPAASAGDSPVKPNLLD